MELLISNRKANHLYNIIETFESGIKLTGSEVKSIRMRVANIVDSFIYIKDNEIWMKNLIVPKYKNSHPLTQHIENRDKKLLLTKKEINKISKLLMDKGITCVPLTFYIKNNVIKAKIAIVSGKKEYDKRNDIKERDIKRDMLRNL